MRDTCSNCSKTAGHTGDPAGSEVEGDGGDLMAETLSIKNARNRSHRVGDGAIHRELQGFKRRLKVLKMTWGLWLLLNTRLEIKCVFADLIALWYSDRQSLRIPKET